MVHRMAEIEGPMYLRLVRMAVPDPHLPGYRFEIGKTERLRPGKDISIFVTGDLVTLALEAHAALASRGISAQVVNVPTIKPLPPEEIIRHGRLTCAAITLEDHNIFGGLGSAVAEIYAEHLQKPLKRLGIPDTFTESDEGPLLRQAYGLNLEHMLAQVDACLHRI
jgi:transketolase